VCAEDEREFCFSVMRRVAVMNMTSEAQHDLLLSPDDSLPIGHPLKAQIVNLVERMTRCLPEIGEDPDPSMRILNAIGLTLWFNAESLFSNGRPKQHCII
jgi:hypothetical protein